jgi:hypothetical protein
MENGKKKKKKKKKWSHSRIFQKIHQMRGCDRWNKWQLSNVLQLLNWPLSGIEGKENEKR